MSDDVAYELAGCPLALPADHNLPRIRSSLPQYGLNLGRVAKAMMEVAGELRLIDVGGNVGDSVAIVRGHAPGARILTIEGYAPYIEYLRRNVKGMAGVVIEPSFVAGVSTGGLARVDAVGGTARLVAEDACGESSQRALDSILAERPEFASAKLFKLDTDGMDVSIILANLGYIHAIRPVIFLEYDPALSVPPRIPAAELWRPLRAAGYRYALLWENTGFYIGCLDVRDPLVGDEVDAAASGWGTQRYFDICLVHSDDSAVADQVRRGEIAYARTAARYGPGAADLPLHARYGPRQLGRAMVRSALRRVGR